MASNLGGVRSSADIDPALAVERATVLVGPALILTTVVLACGLVVTVFSDLPSLRLFGWLSAFAMVATGGVNGRRGGVSRPSTS